jgi:Na+/H+-dicarboxylate symporter
VAVDHLLDMGRSATNVVGNAVASTLVAKWENELTAARPLLLRDPVAAPSA